MMNLLDRIKCWLGWHKWDKYRGYEQIHPHGTARCIKCGLRYKS